MRKLLLIFIVTALVLPLSAHALSFGGFLDTPFGGRIIAVIPCPCNFRSMIVVGPPKGGTFIYIPFISTLYREYQLRPGVWSLGIASGRSSCLVPSFFGCSPIGFGSIIRKIGTSF